MTDATVTNLRLLWQTRVTRDPEIRRLLLNDTTREADPHPMAEAIDRLVSILSIIEIGCFVGALPQVMPPDVLALANSALLRIGVRRANPHHLLGLFAARLDGTPQAPLSEAQQVRGYRLYSVLVGLDAQLEGSDVREALRVLKRRARDQREFDDIVAICGAPEFFATAITKSDLERTDVDRGLAGLRQLFAFAEALERLLVAAREVSAQLEAMFWWRYEYMFSRTGVDVGAGLAGVLDQFDTWTPKGTAELAEATDDVVTTSTMRETLRALARVR